jgi:hypothetical protein
MCINWHPTYNADDIQLRNLNYGAMYRNAGFCWVLLGVSLWALFYAPGREGLQGQRSS